MDDPPRSSQIEIQAGGGGVARPVAPLAPRLRLSAIVPATNLPVTLAACEEAIRSSADAPEEVIIVTGPAGAHAPAARNEGVSQATGDILVFVDADVLVHPDAFTRLRAAFAEDPALAGVFGSYDDAPSAGGVVSSFRNLLHHHVHQHGAGPANTFWTGLGAVERDAFLATGGFDEDLRFMEDIDLGMRLSALGSRVELDPSVQGTHLKRWTLGHMLWTDFFGRGVPWVELLWREQQAPNELNLSWRHRLSAACALKVVVGAARRRPGEVATGLASLGALNRSFYLLLLRRRGPREAAAGVLLHTMHLLTAAAALPAGVVVQMAGRRSVAEIPQPRLGPPPELSVEALAEGARRTAARFDRRRRRAGRASPARAGGPVGVAVLGAGPEGLAAAHVVAQRGRPGAVFEPGGEVGGIARTNEYNGYRFDLGTHRFGAELAPVSRLWEDLLGEELQHRRLLSRVYYNGKYLTYPLTTRGAVMRLGVAGSLRSGVTYLRSSGPAGGARAPFGEWMSSRLAPDGGLPAARHVAAPSGEFRYPRLGAGQMWEAFRARVETGGVPIRLNERCVAIHHCGRRVEEIVLWRDGRLIRHAVDGLLSTLPLSELVSRLRPRAPDEVLAAARRLRHRDCCLVALVTHEAEPFPDNWIYLHDAGTRATRVHNVAAWSESMVVPGTTCLGVEYVCDEGDELWEMPTEAAVEMATRELARIGLIDPTRVVDGTKVAVRRAYPVEDAAHEEALAVIRPYLESFENLETFGRDGLHRSGDEDRTLWTAILAASRLIGGADPDGWAAEALTTLPKAATNGNGNGNGKAAHPPHPQPAAELVSS